MDSLTREMRLAHWEPIIRECRRSGMTVKSWCEQNGVGEKQFYYWQRLLRKAAYNELQTVTPKVSQRFVALPTTINTDVAKPDLVLRTGAYIVEIQNSASEALLAAVMKVISHAE